MWRVWIVNCACHKDRHTKPYAVTVSIAVTLFATSLRSLPPANLLPLLHTSLFSFIWASVTESESRLARTCWSRYAHRCVGFRYREKVGEEEGRRESGKRRHHFSSLQSPCGFLARLARHCSTCGPTFMFFKHLPALFLSLLSLLLPLVLPLCLSLLLHYDIYCHFSCHLQSKCGKWQNNQH